VIRDCCASFFNYSHCAALSTSPLTLPTAMIIEKSNPTAATQYAHSSVAGSQYDAASSSNGTNSRRTSYASYYVDEKALPPPPQETPQRFASIRSVAEAPPAYMTIHGPTSDVPTLIVPHTNTRRTQSAGQLYTHSEADTSVSRLSSFGPYQHSEATSSMTQISPAQSPTAFTPAYQNSAVGQSQSQLSARSATIPTSNANGSNALSCTTGDQPISGAYFQCVVPCSDTFPQGHSRSTQLSIRRPTLQRRSARRRGGRGRARTRRWWRMQVRTPCSRRGKAT
jgi:hypothetical protein